MISKIIQFIKNDIWRIRANKLPAKHSFPLRMLRIVILSLREFGNDQCYLRASALTFYSLLSVVPVFAMAFGVAKGFGLEKMLEQRLLENLQGQEEVLMRIIEFSRSLLENTRGGLVAGIGIALLFWTVIKMLGNIEKSFNHIWGVREARPIGRKFSDYLSLMVICPVLIIFSSSLTVFITHQIKTITAKFELLGYIGPVIHTSLNLLPYVVLWFLLTFLYSFIPNTKIRFTSALMGGIIAGTLYQIIQWVYITFQIGASKYGAIYGSFAALPLFLVWLQMSWLVILFGAEISFAHQNEETYEFEPDCLNVSHAYKKVLSLRTAQIIFKNFAKGREPLSGAEIANTLEAPIRLMRQIFRDLVTANVLTEIRGGGDKERRYQPARSIANLTIKEVIDALDEHGLNELAPAESKEMDKIRERLADFNKLILKSPANAVLKDL